MRKIRVLIVAAIVGASGLLGSLFASSAHAVYCGKVGGVDPCAAACRVAYAAHLHCVFGP